MYDVLTIGQLVLDCLIRETDEPSASSRSRRARSIALHEGGDAFNQSSVLAHLGLKVAVAGFIGSDAAGRIIRESLSTQGCDLSLLKECDGIATPITAISVAADGSRRSVNSPAIALGGRRVSADEIPQVRAVSLASCFRAPLDDPDDNLKIAATGRQMGAPVFCDAKLPVYEIPGIERFRPFFANVDYFFPNETEAGFYSGVSLDGHSGEDDLRKAASFFLNMGVGNVVIKLGARGCFFMNEKESFLIPAPQVRAVDTTGAGDSFVAGFIRARLDGLDEKHCCLFASACASMAVQKEGGGAAMENLSQAMEAYERLLQNQGY